ncbi:hypothetical protein [Mesorhizobium sp. WSM1293]|nr:hypothetical protein [Mesorhizobium sp. WSM1293]
MSAPDRHADRLALRMARDAAAPRTSHSIGVLSQPLSISTNRFEGTPQ